MPTRLLRPLLLMVAAAVLIVVVVALPASLLTHFLPPRVEAGDFSGSLWHGSAARITVNAHDAGALEWHLHPLALLGLTLSADLHWVKRGFVVDAHAAIDRHGIRARDVQGGGPLDDIADLNVADGWRGNTQFTWSELTLAFAGPSAAARAVDLRSAAGDLTLAGLSSPRIADGSVLGDYVLHVTSPAGSGSADIAAEANDIGGPLELKATIHYSPQEHSGLLSGTIRERPDAPAPLRNQIDGLAQLHARDAAGRIPVDLEFTL